MATSDLGRRVAERRTQMGLSLEEAAERAQMAPDYLHHLESDQAPNVPPAALRLLARALDTTVDQLTGAGMLEPPGRAAAGLELLDELDPAACDALLAPGGVGRLVVDDDEGPVCFPVNFVVDGGTIFFRTAEDHTLDPGAGRTCAFEVDHVDDALAEGWSVLVRGRAEVVEDPAEIERVAGLGLVPWVGRGRELTARVVRRTVSGRRIRQR